MTEAADIRARRKRRAAIPSDPLPLIDVISETKTVTPAMVSSKTRDAATAHHEVSKQK